MSMSRVNNESNMHVMMMTMIIRLDIGLELQWRSRWEGDLMEA
jgi:hypothetical protein